MLRRCASAFASIDDPCTPHFSAVGGFYDLSGRAYCSDPSQEHTCILCYMMPPVTIDREHPEYQLEVLNLSRLSSPEVAVALMMGNRPPLLVPLTPILLSKMKTPLS